MFCILFCIYWLSRVELADLIFQTWQNTIRLHVTVCFLQKTVTRVKSLPPTLEPESDDREYFTLSHK